MLKLTILCLGLAAPGGADVRLGTRGEFSFQDAEGKHLDVLFDGRIVARYMYAYDPSTKDSLHETYKPYLHVFDTAGKAPITKGPGGQYTHHRGIFVGWSRIGFGGKRFDRWHMKGGEQVHQEFLKKEAGDGKAVVTSLVHWNDDAKTPIVVEERTFTFTSPPEGAHVLVDLSTTLKAPAGDVELNGDPEHAGIQYRPANEVSRADTVYIFPGEDTDPRKNPDLPWAGETYTLDGKEYSVVIMNHPENPEGTKWSAYRDYGRFGAFPVAKIPKDGSRTLRYRFLVAEGAMLPAEAIQRVCNAFTGRDDAAPKIRVVSSKAKGKKKK